jgi:hypothetical protein
MGIIHEYMNKYSDINLEIIEFYLRSIDDMTPRRLRCR